MEKKQLIIYGAGDLGREIMFAGMEPNLDYSPYWQTIAFIDDDVEKQGNKVEGIGIISVEDFLNSYDCSGCCFIFGIGNSSNRKKTLKKLLNRVPDIKFGKVIHKSAAVMQSVKIAEGAYIGANATVGIGANLCAHSVVNFNCSIGHDVTIKQNSIVSPGCILSGRTTIGENSFIGSGVITYPGVSIGDNCLVSAGAVVARSAKDNSRLIEKPNTMCLPNQ